MATDTRQIPDGVGGKPSPRERLLEAAGELFYREGVQTVGVDRIIEHAGVAKASLYSTFGSKESLVCAFLEDKHAQTAERIKTALAQCDTPRQRILGLFEDQAEQMTNPGFNGCPFANASNETPPAGAIRKVADAHRAWVQALLTELAADAGADDPGRLAMQLQLLYDGAALSGRLDRRCDAARLARDAAEQLLDASLPDHHQPRRRTP